MVSSWPPIYSAKSFDREITMKIERISPGFQASFGKETGCASACHDAHQEAGLENQALQHFDNAYLLWKAVTVRYEQEMQRMLMGDKEAYSRIVPLVRDMAIAHHEFLKTSQPLFHDRP
jgi:hypothetical protein